VDDDCDGTTDEGCGACSGCVGALGVSAPGGRYTVPLGSDSQSGSCGGSGGSEGYLTFTLAATSDVFITTHHAGSVDTVLYVRDCTCSGPELGCNDNGDGLSTSVLRLTALAAGTYNVIVDTKTSMSGSIPVDLYISTPGAASDRCGNPSFIPAGASTVSGNTCAFGSDYDPVANTGCPYVGSGHHNDRVYYFYVPTSRTVTFDGCVSGTTFDATTYYRTICTSTSVAAQPECNDDGCGGMPSCTAGNRPELSATLGPGLYYFFADGYLGVSCECGDYSYDISGL